MFIPDLLILELWFVRLHIDSFKNILESTIVLFKNCVLCGHVKWILSFEGKLETAVSKIFNALINVVHSHADTSLSLELEDFHALLLALSILENNFESSWSVDNEIGGLVLITKSMSSDNNGFFPSRDKSWNIFDDDWFSKHSTVENVSDSTIGAFPHLLEIKLLYSRFIRSNCSALDTNFAFFNEVSSIDSDLVVGSISVFHSEVKILDVEIKEGKDELIFDSFPDDSGHFITIELSDWVFNFDFLELHQNKKDILYAKNYRIY